MSAKWLTTRGDRVWLKVVGADDHLVQISGGELVGEFLVPLQVPVQAVHLLLGVAAAEPGNGDRRARFQPY